MKSPCEQSSILDGKALAQRIRTELRSRISDGVESGLPVPGLATVLVGEDPASSVYVRHKIRACEEVGIRSIHKTLPADAGQAALLETIRVLNQDEEVHGILVQLPLPKEGYSESEILEAILPTKDVDGFHPLSLGALFQGSPGMVPCTPKGILRLVDETGMDLTGKRAVVLGRSNIVGKPVAQLLLARHATVVMCHSRTRDLEAEVQAADLLVAAVGVPELVQGDWIAKGAVVIDVGINRREDGSLVGDVEFKGASKRASWITPVPGGVGPMTIAMLLENTLEAGWENSAG
jgi:methylenetetrahydrofolate dehydrogenase (NADP+)/methenyltetrahydrofolate cyclohydrolase